MILQSVQPFANTAELRLLGLVPDVRLNVSDLRSHQRISLLLGMEKVTCFTD